MSRSPLIPLLACAAVLAGCGDDESLAEATAPVASLRGAPIDGSGDAGFQAPTAPRAAPEPGPDEPADSVVAVVADDGSPESAASTPADEAAADDAETDTGQDEAVALDESSDTAEPSDETALAEDETTADESTADDAEAPKRPEPDENGVYHLAFSDLSLEGEDIDNIIDYLLFPEEFEEGEGFQFPDHLKALDGKQITISGYMIPGRIRQNMVRDFMLVRDLAGCCFGGAPNPDEWIDVVMVDDAEAEYLRYLPITVRGTLSLIGEQDQEGYAVGVYRMKATWAGEQD